MSALLTLCTFVLVPPPTFEIPAPKESSIVPKGAKLELLWTRTDDVEGGLTEGVCAAPDGTMYFSDIRRAKDNGQILRFDPKTKKTTIFSKNSRKSNGLMFDAQGRLTACEGADYGGRGVARWDVKTGKRKVLASKYDGKRFNAPNDLCIDLKGRIYFTDPRYLGHEPRELKHRAVYRIEPDGKVIEITHEVEKPNGIAISPDQKTLYVADHNNGTDQNDPSKPAPKTGAMKIYAFVLDADGKVKGPRKTLVDFGKERGCDGMTLDAKGNIYLTVRAERRPGIMVINPQGKEIAFIPTGPSQPGAKQPVGLPSNCDFGIGKESNVLYVTVDVSLYRIPLKVKGYHIPWAK